MLNSAPRLLVYEGDCKPKAHRCLQKSEPEANFFSMGVNLLEIWSRIQEAFGSQNAAEIARMLNIERQSVYKWRDGKNAPDLQRLVEISNVTGSSLHWLITGQGSRDAGAEVLQPEPTPAEKLLNENSLPEVFNQLFDRLNELEKELETIKRKEPAYTLPELAKAYNTDYGTIVKIMVGNTDGIEPHLVDAVRSKVISPTGERTSDKRMNEK